MVSVNKDYMLTAGEYAKVSYGLGNTKKYLCIHTTDNWNKGADASAHARLQKNGNSRSASWHYTVDDSKAYQSLPHGVRAWHAGSGNYNSIAIEVCVDQGSDWNKSMNNLVELSAGIMKAEGIDINHVKQHNFFTGKNCPREIREGKGGWTWSKFIAELKKELKGDTNLSTSTGGNTATDVGGSLIPDGYWGKATTKALQKALGTHADGIISNQANNAVTRRIIGLTFGKGGSPVVRAMQKKLGVDPDGYIGTKTIKALQKKLGTPIDGTISSPSVMVKEMQKRLNKGTLFK